MTKALLDILACPACRGSLAVSESGGDAGDDITTGELACTACARRYPIERGVPRMLVGQHLERTRQAFTGQWRFRSANRFEKRSVFGHDPVAQVDWLFRNAIGPITRGDWIADAGCGIGQMARAAAARHPDAQILALDFNDTIFDVAEESRQYPNLHFVQADVTNPPVRPGGLAALYSIGVLHCTPDTRAAFRAVSTLIRPGGRLAIWLYPDPSESDFFRRYYLARDVHFLGRGHRIPERLRLALVYLYTALMLPFVFYTLRASGREIKKGTAFYAHPAPNASLLETYRIAVFLLYDDIAPENQFRHGVEEVRGWYDELGFEAFGTDRFGAFWGTRPDLAESRRGGGPSGPPILRRFRPPFSTGRT